MIPTCPKCNGGVFSCRCDPINFQVFIDELNSRPQRAALVVAKEEERLAARALHDFLNKEQKEWIEAGVNLTDILGNECRLEGAYELARVEVDKLEKL